jgi:hypothetical protein
MVRRTKVKSTRVKSRAKTINAKAKDGDNDGGAGPTGPPKGKTSARHQGGVPASGRGVPSELLAKAAAIGAHNAGAAPDLNGALSGSPVRFTGTAQSTITEYSAGAAPARPSGQSS